MTPFTHTTSDMHVDVYQQDVAIAIREAKAHPGSTRSLRRYIARGLVRTGVWLLPDKPDVIAGTVFALPNSSTRSTAQRAA